MKKYYDENKGTLVCYASGSGCLDFVWQNYDGNANANEVTREDIQNLIEGYPEAFSDYDILFINRAWKAMQKIKRVSGDTFCINSPWGPMNVTFHPQIMSSFGFKLTDHEGIEVKHIATKASLKFYLDNENDILFARYS